MLAAEAAAAVNLAVSPEAKGTDADQPARRRRQRSRLTPSDRIGPRPTEARRPTDRHSRVPEPIIPPNRTITIC